MRFLGNFTDGYVFTSKGVFKHQGAYTVAPRRPQSCDKCGSRRGLFHAHGRFKRCLNTISNRALRRIRVWRQRWLCLDCGHTMSNGTPDVIAHVPNCTLVVGALLWCYLQSGKGLIKAATAELEPAAAPRTLARYLKRAKAVAKITQHALREVLIAIREPRPWDEGFAYGLSPPQRLLRRHRAPDKAASLWRALAMLDKCAKELCVNPCLLMARAKIRTETLQSRFLL